MRLNVHIYPSPDEGLPLLVVALNDAGKLLRVKTAPSMAAAEAALTPAFLAECREAAKTVS